MLPDTKALCRVCMASDLEHPVDLYDASPSGLLPSLYEMLRTICAPVFIKSEPDIVMPAMPTKVCRNCQNAIVAAYNLHQQCIETDRRLVELVGLMWELQGGDENAEDCGDPVTSSSQEVLTVPMSVENEVEIPEENYVTSKKDLDKTCSACGKTFSTRWSMIRHKRDGYCDMTNDPKERTCEICNKVLKTVQLLKRHRAMHVSDVAKQATKLPATFQEPVSEGERPVEKLNDGEVDMIKVEALDLSDELEDEEDHTDRSACSQCGELFKNRTSLNLHIKRKRCTVIKLRKLKNFSQGEIEGETNGANESLVVETAESQGNTANLSATNEIQCADCGVTFLSAKAHLTHTKEANCMRKKTFPCKKCGKVFDKITRMHYHLYSHRERLACSKCNLTFKYRAGLLKHIKQERCIAIKAITSQGEPKIRDIQCTICNVTFSSKKAHRKHVKAGDCQQTSTFPCKICGKVFDKLSRMHYHLYSHKKRLACPRCYETFKYRAGLLNHIKYKRCSRVKVKTFPQGELDNSEETQVYEQLQNEGLDVEEETSESFMIEMQTLEVDTAKMTESGDFQCTDCGVTLSSLRAYRNHVQAGNCQQISTFPCKICGKVFDKLSRMHYHLYSHKERLACSRCDETFKYRAGLMKHINHKRCSGRKTNTFQEVSHEELETQVQHENSVETQARLEN